MNPAKECLLTRTEERRVDRKPKDQRGSVVITGASTGIGQACAMYLDRLGFHVFGGVRKAQDGHVLQENTSGRISPLFMDITDTTSLSAEPDIVAAETNSMGLSGLINNAGIVIAGPIEFLSLDDIRMQYEVNVLGQIAVMQAFLPLLRKARGRIINMGSINGKVVTPFISPYAASKFSLEAITDSLRMELRPWSMSVSIIQPGSVATPIWKKSIEDADKRSQQFPAQAHSLYAPAFEAVRSAAERTAKEGMPSDVVARSVAHALTSKRPRTRYLVGGAARIQAILKHFLPNMLPMAALQMMLAVTGAVVADGFISFFGLRRLTSNWGTLIYDAFLYANIGGSGPQWHVLIPTAMAFTLFALAFYLVSRGLHKVADPKIREDWS